MKEIYTDLEKNKIKEEMELIPGIDFVFIGEPMIEGFTYTCKIELLTSKAVELLTTK